MAVVYARVMSMSFSIAPRTWWKYVLQLFVTVSLLSEKNKTVHWVLALAANWFLPAGFGSAQRIILNGNKHVLMAFMK